ncbi:hypothetical protein O1B78_002006 [Vibrio cholerae]|nr:hypothetical protein [Vibrio cholerae]
MAITYPQAAMAAFAIIGATATATWNIRNDRIEELTTAVESYKQAESWKVPEVIQKLDKAVTHLNNELGLIDENKSKTKEINSLQKEVASLTETIKTQKSQLSDLKLSLLEKDKFIKTLFSETKEVVLHKNKSVKFFGSEIIVALNEASNITGYAEITVNNDKHRIEVGSVIPVVSKDNDCKLIFNEFAGYNVINFSLLCKKI